MTVVKALLVVFAIGGAVNMIADGQWMKVAALSLIGIAVGLWIEKLRWDHQSQEEIQRFVRLNSRDDL